MSTVSECRFKQKRLQMPLELFSVGNAADSKNCEVKSQNSYCDQQSSI